MHTCSGSNVRCYATGGVGVGWGGDVHVLRRCTHVLAFMLDVTQQVGLGWGGVGDVHVLRRCTHVLAFMLDVTQQVGLGWGGVGMFTFLEDAHMFWHSC